MRTQILALCLFLNLTVGRAYAQNAYFTYQGRLSVGGSPVSGTYDFQFTLRDATSGGIIVAGPITNAPTSVISGAFTVQLDFGSAAFNGASRWLEIGIRQHGNVNPYEILSPRQPISSSPYAVRALVASTLDGSLPDAQLSTNIPRLSGANTFSGTVAFSPPSGSAFAVNNTKLIKNLNADLLDGFDAAAFWKIGGNLNTTNGANFLGTTDTQPLEFKVNNQRVLRLEPAASSSRSQGPNVIGGYSGNSVGAGFFASTIAGGGLTDFGTNPSPNVIFGNYSTISGGVANRIHVHAATIGGGVNHTISTNAAASTISGGDTTRIGPNSYAATVGGGESNSVEADSPHATISGGNRNIVEAASSAASIGGGQANRVGANGQFSCIVGGAENNIRTQVPGGETFYASIGGGLRNFIENAAHYATIPGGYLNVAAGVGSMATGRRAHAMHEGSMVWNDSANAEVFASTGPNQFLIRASGGVGIGTTVPQATLHINHAGRNDALIIQKGETDTPRLSMGHGPDGAGREIQFFSSTRAGTAGFVPMTFWTSDRERMRISLDGNVGIGTVDPAQETLQVVGSIMTEGIGPRFVLKSSHANGQQYEWYNDFNGVGSGILALFNRTSRNVPIAFTASGNVGIGTGIPGSKLEVDGVITCTALVETSDRHVKEHLICVNGKEILDRLAGVPIQTWNFTNDVAKTRHIGPMAQDFHTAFGVGADDKHIATLDANGVALAAIQGLNQKLEAQLKERDAQIDTLRKAVTELREMITALAKTKGNPK